MKLKFNYLSFIVLGIIILGTSCKDDNEHADPILLTDDMSLTVSIKSSSYTPQLFDNYIIAIKRDSLNGNDLDGRKLVINAQLNGNEKLQIILTNWESDVFHPDGIKPSTYVFGPVDTMSTRTRIVLGDSTYTNKPGMYYFLSNDYIYKADTTLPGSIIINSCNPIKRTINGLFTCGCVALPPYSDTVYVQGAFTGLKYYQKQSE